MPSGTSARNPDQKLTPKTVPIVPCFLSNFPGLFSFFFFHCVLVLLEMVNTDQIFTAVFGGVKTEVKIWGSTRQVKFSWRLGGYAGKNSRRFLGVGFLASSAL